MIFRKTIPYFIFWCMSITLTAQTSRIDRPDRFNSLDSLEQVLDSGKLSIFEKSDLLLELSRIYRMSGDSAKSRTYAVEALKLALKNGLKNMEAAAYTTLGGHYLVNDMHYVAHVNFKKAEKLFLQTNDRKWLSAVYQSFMVLFRNIEDYENTEYYAEKVLEMAIERGDLKTEVLALFFLGWARYYDNTGQDALNYYRDLYYKSVQINHNYTAYIALSSGMIYVQQNSPREALQYLHWVREYCETSQVIILPEIYAFLAEAYTMLHQVDSAEYYIQKALNLSNLDNESKLTLLRSQSLIASSKNDYLNAMESYKKYHQLSDSIAKARKSIEISRLKNWYELEQKDIENELLQQEKQKQQKLLLLMSVGLLIIISLLVVSIIFYRKSSKQNSELNKMHSLKDKIFSIVSHDLRSPINSLANTLKLANSLTINTENKTRILKNVSANVDNAYALIDNLLLWSKNQIKEIRPISENFNIQNEIKLVVNDLSNIADEKFIVIDNNTQKHSIDTDINMFRVIMRNLITNAIKYSHIKGKITINSELSDNKVVISVKDRGIGMTQAIHDTLFNLPETKSALGTNNETGTGLGLVLCSEFAKKIGGKIWFDSKEGEGSTFFVALPKMS